MFIIAQCWGSDVRMDQNEGVSRARPSLGLSGRIHFLAFPASWLVFPRIPWLVATSCIFQNGDGLLSLSHVAPVTLISFLLPHGKDPVITLGPPRRSRTSLHFKVSCLTSFVEFPLVVEGSLFPGSRDQDEDVLGGVAFFYLPQGSF